MTEVKITTLERQFGFSSSQTGIIVSANDVGFLVCVLFVSYSASRVHIPRALGLSTVIFGVSGLICALPHFIFGVQHKILRPDNNGTTHNTSDFGALCSVNVTSELCENDTDSRSSISSHVAPVSLVIIVIGMAMQGIGKSPRSSLTVKYIDDNGKRSNTGLNIGVIITTSIVGPALAFILGGTFTRMYVTLQETTLTPKHPKWIGAWWLGYVIFGTLSLLIALPLFFYPRRLQKREVPRKPEGKVQISVICSEKSKDLPEKKSDFSPDDQREKKHPHTTGEGDPVKIKAVAHLFKDFLKSLLRLWTNPVYVCITGSACCMIFSISGSSTFTPKYLENMFNLPAFKTNYILGGQTFVAACSGVLLGGYMSKRLRMTAVTALRFSLVVMTTAVAAVLTGFFLQCKQPTVHNWPSENVTCNGDCLCDDDSYFAVCGDDGKTYYSPCTAGCTNQHKGVFWNCSCIPGGSANTGTCDYGCGELYIYILFIGIRSLFATMAIVPKIIVTIRCVKDEDKAIAVGFESFVTSLIGWLLGPIVLGYVIDGVCTIWDIQCGVKGRCLLYDHRLLQLRFHAFTSIPMALSVLFLLVAYIHCRRTGFLGDKNTATPDKIGKFSETAFDREEIILTSAKSIESFKDNEKIILESKSKGDKL
ncbi:solute carrier organic anion transporter family member 1B2-like [Physella acuta]|uniref:solute carrier organic anion transporter family member 1B2-like n=1 Tax=Physella acuta TaxID=109671 RepID=UPI0027DD54FC|nr:solute carrier organic anion transporter family member 1B2-like [Physella acuta]